MKICYLLESTELCGGVRVVFDQARALIERGHTVWIRSKGGDFSWYPYTIFVEYVERLDTPFDSCRRPDALVCTYWTTIQPGLNLLICPTFHLCQGYEGDFPELEPVRPMIEETYHHTIPKITVGPWISQRLTERFGDDVFPVHCVGQIVDTNLFCSSQLLHLFSRFVQRKKVFRILMVGDCFVHSKGIEDGLRALAVLRQRGYSLCLLRVASIRDTREQEETITKVDHYYFRIDPKQMAVVYRKSDLLLAPTRAQEGFGLPFAEALATGLPAVATRIPSYMSFDTGLDYAVFVDSYDVQGMAEAIIRIINDRKLVQRLRHRGPKLIQEKFHARIVAQKLEQIIQKYQSD